MILDGFGVRSADLFVLEIMCVCFVKYYVVQNIMTGFIVKSYNVF